MYFHHNWPGAYEKATSRFEAIRNHILLRWAKGIAAAAGVRALWPGADMEQIRRHLESIPRICAGDPETGPIALLPPGQRFHWLTSPRNTVLQISAVRTGLAESPEAVLEHLSGELVA